MVSTSFFVVMRFVCVWCIVGVMPLFEDPRNCRGWIDIPPRRKAYNYSKWTEYESLFLPFFGKVVEKSWKLEFLKVLASAGKKIDSGESCALRTFNLRIAVVQVYEGPLDIAQKIAVESIRRWCEVHGYSHYLETKSTSNMSNRHPIWSKLVLAYSVLSSVDYVLTMDTDIAIVDMCFALETSIAQMKGKDVLLIEGITVSRILNSGFFVVKNSEFGRAFLQRWWRVSHDSVFWANCEQTALYYLFYQYISGLDNSPCNMLVMDIKSGAPTFDKKQYKWTGADLCYSATMERFWHRANQHPNITLWTSDFTPPHLGERGSFGNTGMDVRMKEDPFLHTNSAREFSRICPWISAWSRLIRGKIAKPDALYVSVAQSGRSINCMKEHASGYDITINQFVLSLSVEAVAQAARRNSMIGQLACVPSGHRLVSTVAWNVQCTGRSVYPVQHGHAYRSVLAELHNTNRNFMLGSDFTDYDSSLLIEYVTRNKRTGDWGVDRYGRWHTSAEWPRGTRSAVQDFAFQRKAVFIVVEDQPLPKWILYMDDAVFNKTTESPQGEGWPMPATPYIYNTRELLSVLTQYLYPCNGESNSLLWIHWGESRHQRFACLNFPDSVILMNHGHMSDCSGSTLLQQHQQNRVSVIFVEISTNSQLESVFPLIEMRCPPPCMLVSLYTEGSPKMISQYFRNTVRSFAHQGEYWIYSNR